MADYTKESDARIIIDDLLRQAGWDPADKSQVLTEVSVKDGADRVAESQAELQRRAATRTRDRNEVSTGRADYVLLSQNGRPLAVIEAKRAAFHPYRAKQQALSYAKQIGAPFIFLTNGELIYFSGFTNSSSKR